MFPQREIKIQSFRLQSSTKGHIMNEFQKFLLKVKIQFFHARQPREEIFEIRSYCGLFLMTAF